MTTLYLPITIVYRFVIESSLLALDLLELRSGCETQSDLDATGDLQTFTSRMLNSAVKCDTPLPEVCILVWPQVLFDVITLACISGQAGLNQSQIVKDGKEKSLIDGPTQPLSKRQQKKLRKMEE